MASEAISEHLILKKNFSGGGGGMPPDPPSVCVLTHAPSSLPPQSQVPSAAPVNYLPAVSHYFLRLFASLYNTHYLDPHIILSHTCITSHSCNLLLCAPTLLISALHPLLYIYICFLYLHINLYTTNVSSPSLATFKHSLKQYYMH